MRRTSPSRTASSKVINDTDTTTNSNSILITNVVGCWWVGGISLVVRDSSVCIQSTTAVHHLENDMMMGMFLF